ncbi:13724_t:CDS:2, partial [Acaulospora colombiana]
RPEGGELGLPKPSSCLHAAGLCSVVRRGDAASQSFQCHPFGLCEPCPEDSVSLYIRTNSTGATPHGQGSHPILGEIPAWETCGRIVGQETADFWEFVTLVITDVFSANRVCGLCQYEKDRLDAIARKVKGAKDLPPGGADYPEPKEKEIKWVECAVSTCRAQYSLVNAGGLRVRPKCHYCRQGIECPWVTCCKCTNRIVVPEEYREGKDDQFECFACQSGKATKVDEETSTQALAAENGTAWLGFNPDFDLFHNHSAFKIFSKHGAAAFTGIPADKEFTLHSKHIFNADVVRLQIEGRVASGEVEKGTCSLCFDDIPYEKLLPACGRSGCRQRVDEDCLARWYGENGPGKLLNPLQLACPFCRRKPTIKILTKYNPTALSVGDLAPAIADRAWYYAWCVTCGFAKRAVERACADAGLPNIRDFVCEDCTEQRAALEARLRAEAEALRAARDEARLAAVNNQLRAVKSTKMAKITPCPRCGVFVQKTYGCNHITCGKYIGDYQGLWIPIRATKALRRKAVTLRERITDIYGNDYLPQIPKSQQSPVLLCGRKFPKRGFLLILDVIPDHVV